MSTAKGSNGIKGGQLNEHIFIDLVIHVDDFKPYPHQGVLSVSRIAREYGLNCDVFYTNPEIRDFH